VTLATLVALLVLPFWVFASAAGEWESRLAIFKTIALALTVAYFVAGVAWMTENEKRRRLNR
jgi:O-antigen ligase